MKPSLTYEQIGKELGVSLQRAQECGRTAKAKFALTALAGDYGLVGILARRVFGNVGLEVIPHELCRECQNASPCLYKINKKNRKPLDSLRWCTERVIYSGEGWCGGHYPIGKEDNEAGIHILNADKAAKMMAVSRAQLLEMAKKKEIPSVMIGGRKRPSFSTIDLKRVKMMKEVG